MKYDYMVIGAGSAGAILAARLSEDPTKSVILLEAGSDYLQLAQQKSNQFLCWCLGVKQWVDLAQLMPRFSSEVIPKTMTAGLVKEMMNGVSKNVSPHLSA